MSPIDNRPHPYEWKEADQNLSEYWDRKLVAAGCSYRQFPFWARAHDQQSMRVRLFHLGDQNDPIAIVTILEVGRFPFRSALIDRGPYFFDAESADIPRSLDALVNLARKLRYVFVRFTAGQESVFSIIARLDSVETFEPYPFYRDPRNSLLVPLEDNDDAMMSSFSSNRRNEIRRGQSLGYQIRMSASDIDFELAWELFEKVASRKTFILSKMPKSFWREVLRLGNPAGLARLYLCFYRDRILAAQIIIRDGITSELTLSALDTLACDVKPSPAALLNWTGMVDSRDLGCKYYDLGGPGDPKRGNNVLEFKKKFNPITKTAPLPLCVVLRPRSFWIWHAVWLRGWRALRRFPVAQKWLKRISFNK